MSKFLNRHSGGSRLDHFAQSLQAVMPHSTRAASSGQVQPISAVIITGIVVSLVGVAYFWGVPLIQKRASMTEFQSMERFVSTLQDRISELARSGAGEFTLDINQGFIKLTPYNDIDEGEGEGGNNFTLEFVVDQPLIFPNTTLYLGATSMEEIDEETGTYGESSPAVVTLREEELGQQYKITAEIVYRELLKEAAPKRGYIIALCKKGDTECDDVMTGNQRITLSFGKNVQKTGEASNGGDLVITYINVMLA